MDYMLMFYQSADDFATRTDPARSAAYYAGWTAYVQVVYAAGIAKSGDGLQAPATATTLRIGDGKRRVQDGPFAESKEQLGGFFVIDVPDLDSALAWAARAPCAATGGVEVRPTIPRQASA
ncbi:MAG TPA: YciI family protein [Caldimonas sp.]